LVTGWLWSVGLLPGNDGPDPATRVRNITRSRGIRWMCPATSPTLTPMLNPRTVRSCATMPCMDTVEQLMRPRDARISKTAPGHKCLLYKYLRSDINDGGPPEWLFSRISPAPNY
jgi:hypothetical protein